MIDAFSKQEIKMGKDTRFLEMFLAIHSDFFIMNPRSTFSFEVFVVRTILGLDSVPIMAKKDFYLLAKDKIGPENPLWVTFESIVNTVLDLYMGMIERGKRQLTNIPI